MKRASSSMISGVSTLILAIFLAFSCKSASETATGFSPDTLKVADRAMKTYVDEEELPCVSTLILKDGEEVQRLVYGYSVIEEKRLLGEDAIFRIYSMSKPITAAALMILYDEGRFRLDDPVAMYIPQFRDTKVWVDGKEVEQDQPITVRHLLTHTAGLCYGWEEGSHVDSLYRKAASEGYMSLRTLAEMINILAGIPLKRQPGTKYEYSLSIDVAGYLVEVLSGMPFDEFLQTRLFGPLGMEDTGFEVPEEDWDRLAMIYTKDEETGKLIPREDLTSQVKQKVTLLSGGGGMVSTISDYARFAQMLLNDGTLNGVRVLEESTVHLIMSDQMPPGVIYQKGIGYGLGGQVVKKSGAYSWSGMASTDFVADPENMMVILAFTQYVPFMQVPFAEKYKELVQNAFAEPKEEQ